MKLTAGHCYHVYTRGNNRERVFPQPRNYAFFLGKLRQHLLPHVDLLAYCLMPNHFHLMIRARDAMETGPCQTAYRTLLSSYTRAIQKQEGRTGSLFQQNSKAKDLSQGSESYALTCFCYIHQNPLRAGLVTDLKDWPYSSYADYAGLRDGSFCALRLATELLGLPDDPLEFQAMMDQTIPQSRVARIF
jgi:putative transposase